ncbi:hypothetical protein VC34_18515 [Pseudomonas fluorescens]|uniref:ATPase AAA-type core domain-containing protein n=2 Tax=Pseudomonas fluorescens TaxID=294 RepID=A0A0F4TCR8_PSEFL|nr:hypothetical protein VC34_18515 [Pseudomonas fluorescens]
MEVGGASKDDIENLGDSYNDDHVDLSEMFQAAKKMVFNRSKTRYTTDSEQESVQHFCISGGFVPGSLSSGELGADDDIAQVNLVSFIDESLYFNFPLNGAEVALEGKTIESNIDRTLWLLIHAYIAKRLNQSHMNAVLSKLGSFEKNGSVDFASDDVQSWLKIAIQEMKESSDLENGPVFAELNKFYGMTNRKLVWRDDTFQMIVPDEGVIPFTDFSKGEKTLLALLLTVSLYGDSAIFLLDEPDLSLHVEWQRLLLPAMLRLAPESQFVIGTHSPFLVMNTQSETVVNLAKKFKESN